MAGLFLLPSMYAQTRSDIEPPQKRAEAIELARKLLTVEPHIMSYEELAKKDPFNSTPLVIEKEEPAVRVEVLPDREVLAGVAPGINPSGTMQMGGKYILLFGQKMFKVGDVIPIVFRGSNYDIEISGIERTSFTLRLNKEEIIRPIKP